MNRQVAITEGIFKHSETKGKEYLLDLDIDRLIAPCYEAVSKQAKKPRYGGWESTAIAGHSIGHWLSGAAAMYQATKEPQLKDKISYALNELAKVQNYDSEGYVSGFPRDCFDQVFTGEFEVDNFSLAGSWVPWYSIDKIYAGLIDVYNLLGIQQALDILVKLADWAKKGLANLTDEEFDRMLICEHGGMNEVMADLYLITKNEAYLKLAKRFCHKAILDPLAEGIDDLEGKHANTQIPKVIGAAKIYEITGEERYKRMATFFWHQVTEHRSYVTGGNSINEHFGPEREERLGIQTTETCNTYNMLKLTEFLYRWDPKKEYMDYYERALFNHILGSQDPETGMTMYFVPTQPGHFKIYNSPEDSFWCCTGTGMENPGRYTRNIYESREDKLFVNLFISSKIVLEDEPFQLRQETAFPKSERTKLFIEEADQVEKSLLIRVPDWVSDDVTVTVNEQAVKAEILDGYLVLSQTWQTDDVIEVQFPMNLHIYVAKDDPNKQAIMYGPILLAGALGRENFPETDILENHMSLDNHPLIEVPTLVTEERDPHQWIHPVAGETLVFETAAVGQPGDQKIRLIPFYDLHHERYAIYWNVMDQASYNHFHDQEQAELRRLNEVTVDLVTAGEQQPEVEHDVQSLHSTVGYSNIAQASWRDSRKGGFFSYQMKVDPQQAMYVMVTYFGNDTNVYVDGEWLVRQFSIYVDDEEIAVQTLDHEKPDELFHVIYNIPQSLTKGKEQVEVTFTAGADKVAGGVFEVRTIHTKDI